MADLRRELECRTLSSKGLKSQLIARLTKAIKSEQEKEEQEAEDKAEEVRAVNTTSLTMVEGTEAEITCC